MEQNINFQKKLDKRLEEIRKLQKTPTLLLHSCCGPCSSYCLDYLTAYFQITVFYYNPNIYPSKEYELRLAQQKRLIEEAWDGRVRLFVPPYDHRVFLEAVKGLEREREGGARCEKCFELRLRQTSAIASEQKFDYFGTTLTVSPHKNAMILNRVGHEAEAAASGVSLWLDSDFKKKNGYLRSVELSEQYHLYRQQYCGCEFSL